MPLWGHSGVNKTLEKINLESSLLETYEKSVENYIKNCDTCQRSKNESIPYPGLLHSLPTIDNVWIDVTMDFITHLPKSSNATVIYVVVDQLSKYAQFFSSHILTLQSKWQKYFNGIFKLYGMPKTIIGDRDSIFLSNFRRELFDLQGCTLKYISAYHPQTDGQTEVTNKILETYLRCFVSHQPSEWTNWLTLVEFRFNTSWKESANLTPYEVLYGRKPPILLSYIPHTTRGPNKLNIGFFPEIIYCNF